VKIVKSDRDSSFDRHLAEALEAPGVPVLEGGCLDAETLAAWADGALRRQEREAVDAHAADCPRCQAMLAAIIRTAPAPVTATLAWRKLPLGWLVPLTAAAAAVVLWVVVPGPTPPQQRPGPVATVAETTTTPPPPAADQARPLQSESQPQSPRAVEPGAVGGIKAPSPVSPSRVETKNEDLAAQAATAPREKAKASDTNALTEPDRSKEASAGSGSSRDGRVARPAGDAVTQASPAPPAAATTTRAFTLARASAAGSVIVSPNPDIRWRILPGGAVEHSTDTGLTWRTQETGATVTLTAGASPSPTVCWLVGPEGTVLLSTDGRLWQRLPFPEPAPLAFVRATDHKTATVTAADGRTFGTTDGGASWSRSRAN
jgi:hypothetical protein